MRTIFGKISMLVLATGLAGSAIVAGCSSTPDNKPVSGDQGSVGFQLDVGGGATINTMHVRVYGNSLGALGASTNIVKDLDVAAIAGATTAFSLTLPAGTNYQVALSSPDNATCTGTGTFSVLAGQSSTIAVTLSCASTDVTGGTGVNVTACTPPVVNSVFVGPNNQAVGHVVQLDASVEAGSTIQWTGTGTGAGTFTSSTAATTNFTCTGAGPVTIQLALAKNGCSTTKIYAVTCTVGTSGVGGTGGGGAAGSGAIGGGGTAGSVAIGGGGTAGSVAIGGGGTAGSVAIGGGGTAGSVAIGGGGTAGTGAVSGGGTAGTGGSACTVDNENGTGQVCTAAFTVDECGPNCTQITSDACQACEHADTSACYDDGDPTDGSSLLNMAAAIAFYGGSATPARVQAGIAAEACIYSSGCGTKAGLVFTNCYCGTSGSACTTPGAANGVCKSQLEAALDTTNPLTIATNIGDPSFGGGVAQVRVACDKTQCASACLH